MNKIEVKKCDSISMKRFLESYLVLDNEVVVELLSELSHKELKILCKELCNINLCTLPFDIVDDEDVRNGYIVLVADKSGHTAPYRNPLKENSFSYLLDNQPSFIGPFYDPCFTKEDYEDYIENIASDPTVTGRQIRLVGILNKTSREE